MGSPVVVLLRHHYRNRTCVSCKDANPRRDRVEPDRPLRVDAVRISIATVTTTERARIDFPSRIGVWWASETWSMPEAQEVAREIEELGYGSLFIPEVVGKECLTQSAAFLAATERLVVGTGIANIHVRIPSAAETGARTLTALYPGRFVLGLGVSHAPLVEHGMGGVYAKPLATMRAYLEKMAAVARA